jgi:2-oxoglutarate dehydrogenase complex dehydrogenase (E1) component-like enzyme
MTTLTMRPLTSHFSSSSFHTSPNTSIVNERLGYSSKSLSEVSLSEVYKASLGYQVTAVSMVDPQEDFAGYMETMAQAEAFASEQKFILDAHEVS